MRRRLQITLPSWNQQLQGRTRWLVKSRELQADLGALAAQQLKMDTLRGEERKIFATAREDFEHCIAGIQKASDIFSGILWIVFRSAARCSRGSHELARSRFSIISILQVIESDLSENLAELSLSLTEQEAESSYQRLTQSNHFAKVSKQQDVKYKQEESTHLRKAAGEFTSDRDSASADLSAVVQYLDQLYEMCVAKAETYGERDSRRAAEIAGSNEALTILSQSSFLRSPSPLHHTSVRRS